MQERKRRGRPPGGEQPGERVVDYPQLSVRVPRATLRKLRAAATVQGLSHAKVLADAVDRYLDALPPDQKTLVEGLLRRATDVFEQPSKRSHTDRAAKPITVLNVDDHEAALFARSSILRREGWNVLEAQTGRSALEAVLRHQPDVVLLDVHLPDINGTEVCRRIKADAATRHIKVVQVSASVRAPLDQLHCLEEGGADMYLVEPLSRGTLLSVIDRLMKGGTAA
jgi:CheY-like chemotaxis protein